MINRLRKKWGWLGALVLLVSSHQAVALPVEVGGTADVFPGLNMFGFPYELDEPLKIGDLPGKFGDGITIDRIEWLVPAEPAGSRLEQCRFDVSGIPLDPACDELVQKSQGWFVHTPPLHPPDSYIDYQVWIDCDGWTTSLEPGSNLVSFPCSDLDLTPRALLYGLNSQGRVRRAASIRYFDGASGRWQTVAQHNEKAIGPFHLITPDQAFVVDMVEADQFTDLDGDGVRDEDEAALGLYENNPDSDGDGVIDGVELLLGTEPALPDSDEDGLKDGEELELGTDPLNPDSDWDGLWDGEEVARGTNPLYHDSDGDGFNDGDEVADGSNPLDPKSIPPTLFGDPPLVRGPGFTLYNAGGGTDPGTFRFTSARAPGFSLFNAAANPLLLGEDDNRLLTTGFSLFNAAANPLLLGEDENRLLTTGFSLFNNAASPLLLGEDENRLITTGFSLFNAAASPLLLGEEDNQILTGGFSLFNQAFTTYRTHGPGFSVENLLEAPVSVPETVRGSDE